MSEEQLPTGTYEVKEDGSVEQVAVTPQGEEKHNVHKFLSEISRSKDTTKTGNLGEQELVTTPYAERTYKRMQLDCDVLCDDPIWADYFKNSAELVTATSLSKDGFLDKLAIVQRRELADVSPERKPNSGWFSKKDKNINAGGSE
jgi:hypothetical protein